jgi:hypothetical protein
MWIQLKASDLGELVTTDKLDERIPVPHGENRISCFRLQIIDSGGQQGRSPFKEAADASAGNDSPRPAGP